MILDDSKRVIKVSRLQVWFWTFIGKYSGPFAVMTILTPFWLLWFFLSPGDVRQGVLAISMLVSVDLIAGQFKYKKLTRFILWALVTTGFVLYFSYFPPEFITELKLKET